MKYVLEILGGLLVLMAAEDDVEFREAFGDGMNFIRAVVTATQSMPPARLGT